MPLHLPLPTAQIWHLHNLHHQARPSREMRSPLALTGLWVILLPCEAGLGPGLVDGFDEVEA